MIDLTRKITPVHIEEELKNSYLDYAMSVLIGRALPDVRDGLKPVHRRVLYAMHVLGNYWNKPYKKSSRVVGDVLGKYHPHGDSAVYDTIVRMAQPFSLRYMLVDGQGNFGSVDGDAAAAMRYTEVRMSQISHELLTDLQKDTVNFVYNYDGTEQIPVVIPTKIPNLLINGASGIAVGMATNIPPHNLSEVISGCLAYIDDENISIERLMEHIPGPDFPTAALINGRKGIEEAYRMGRGKIYVRSRAVVEKNTTSGRDIIIVHEIPYQVNKARLIEKIAELVKEKRVEGIHALRDESDKDGMRIVIEINRNAVGAVVLNNLYAMTQLQITFGINMVALYQGKPKLLGLKDIIEAFILHRREVVTRRTIFDLHKILSRVHILEGLTIALANIDQIIEIIRHVLTPEEAKYILISRHWELSNVLEMLERTFESSCLYWSILDFVIHTHGKYYLTEKQAQEILDIRMHKFTGMEHNKLLDEYKELLNISSELVFLLESPKHLMEKIREELLAIREQFGDVRRTEITINYSEIKIEDLIHPEDVVVTLSHQGYVKYQPVSDYEAQRRGGKGKYAANVKEEDFIDCLLVANTHDTILCFSNLGRLYWMEIYLLPEASRGARGRPINNFLPLEEKERITAILPVRQYDEKGRHVFMATASGTVKKTALTEFSRRRKTGILAVNLKEGDELIGVDFTNGSNEVMLFSSNGKVVRFSENKVRSMGRIATGVRGIHLSKGDKVVSLIIPHSKGDILTLTQNGYGKRTSINEYPTKFRATQGVISIKISDRNGNVVGAVQVEKKDQIIMITNYGKLVRTHVSSVSIVSRNTHGVLLIRTSDYEKVVGVQRVVKAVQDY